MTPEQTRLHALELKIAALEAWCRRLEQLQAQQQQAITAIGAK